MPTSSINKWNIKLGNFAPVLLVGSIALVLIATGLAFFVRSLVVTDLSITNRYGNSAVISFLTAEPISDVRAEIVNDKGDLVGTGEPISFSTTAHQFRFSNLNVGESTTLKLSSGLRGFSQLVNLTEPITLAKVVEPTIVYGIVSNYQDKPVSSGANVILTYDNNEILAGTADEKGVWTIDLSPLLVTLGDQRESEKTRSINNSGETVSDDKYVTLSAVGQEGRGQIQMSADKLLALTGKKAEVTGLRIGKGLPPESLALGGKNGLRLDLDDDQLPKSQSKLVSIVSADNGEGSGAATNSCAGTDANGDGVADSADPASCQVGYQCNWRNGWAKKCLQPFTGAGGTEVRHEWVAYCDANGMISANIPSGASNLYSQVNSNCAADKVGQKLPNAELNDACPGDPSRMLSDPGGCGSSSIGGGDNGGSGGSGGGSSGGSGGESGGSTAQPVDLTMVIRLPNSASLIQIGDSNVIPVLRLNRISTAGELSTSYIPFNNDAPTSLNVGDRISLAFGFYPEGRVGSVSLMTCTNYSLSIVPSGLPAPDENQLFVQNNPQTAGWAIPEEYAASNADISQPTFNIEVSNCTAAIPEIEVGITPEVLPVPEEGNPANPSPAGISQALIDGVCPIHQDFLGGSGERVTIYQDANGNRGGGTHSGLPISTQNATDLKVVGGSCAGTCGVSKLRDGDINVKVVSPTRAKVVSIRSPQRTVELYGGGICQDTPAGADVDPTKAFANIYMGGLTVLLRVLDDDGSQRELIRLTHVEGIQRRLLGAVDAESTDLEVSKGETIGYIYDGTFGGQNNNSEPGANNGERTLFEEYNLDQSEPNGCFDPNNPHLHFSLISSNVTETFVRPGDTSGRPIGEYFEGNTINSTSYVQAKCGLFAPDGDRFDDSMWMPASSSNSPKLQRGALKTVVAEGEKLASSNPSSRFTPPTPGGYAVTINGKKSSTAEIVYGEGSQSVRYFLDANSDGIRQQSERYISDNELSGLNIEFAPTGSLYNYRLERGWNLIGLPFANPSLSKASQLYSAIVQSVKGRVPEANLNLTVATQVDQQNYDVYTKVFNNNSQLAETGLIDLSRDFGLISGKGVYVYSSEPMNFSLSGNALQSGDYPQLTPGWNLLNLWKDNDVKSTKVLSDGLLGTTVHEIAQYQSGSFDTQSKDKDSGKIFGSEFNLDARKSYFIRVD